MNFTALQSEIDSDPLQLGYAGKSDQQIADLLNAVNASYSCPITNIDKDSFVLGIAPALYAALPTLTAIKQQGWQYVLSAINGASAISLASSNVQALLSQAVSDGLLTTSQIAAIQTKSPCSRAEVLFGADTVISISDISMALRGVK